MSKEKEKKEEYQELEEHSEDNIKTEERGHKKTGKKKRKKSIMVLTKELFFYRITAYLGLELFYMIAAMLVLLPVFDHISYRVLRKVGYSYLTSELMMDFFEKPLVIFSIFCILAVVGIVLLWLATLAVSMLYHWRKQENCTIWHIVMFTGKRFLMLVKPKNVLLLPDTWILTLFLNIPIIVWIFSKFRMPKYILNSFLKIGIVKEILAIVVVLGVIEAMLHFWELPYMILEGMTRKEARRKSRNLWKNHIMRIFLCSISLQAITTIFLICLCIAALTAGAVIVLLFIPSELKISVYWTMYDHILIYIVCFIGMIGSLLHIAFIIAAYCICKEEIGEEHNIVEHEMAKEEHKRIAHRKLILCSAFFLLCLDIFFTYDTIYNGRERIFDSMDTIKITAHRGCSKEAPENTIPAIKAAIENMVDYAEIDVQLTKDGEIVLMHDNSLWRTARVKGTVADYTYEELKSFEAGGWFGSEFIGTEIPKLEEVVELCKGRIKLNIEIKSKKNTDELERKVVELIERYGFQKQCIITSIYQKTLQIVKELNPDIRTGYIISSAYGNYFDDDNIDFFSMKSSFVTEGILRRAHKRGKEVHVWTVNTKKEMNRMSQLGVDNIITDVPLAVKEFLYDEDDNSTLFGLLQLVLR